MKRLLLVSSGGSFNSLYALSSYGNRVGSYRVSNCCNLFYYLNRSFFYNSFFGSLLVAIATREKRYAENNSKH